jgi:predicted nucleic acid-binding protein
VDHLRGHRAFTVGRDVVHVSVVTRAELFAGHATDEARVTTLLEPFRELPIDRTISERAGRIRRTTSIVMPDALIAGTALEHGLTLITRNMRQFEGVKGLRVRSPAGEP